VPHSPALPPPAPPPTAGDAALSATELRELIAGNPLFSKFDDLQIAELLAVVRDVRTLAAGETLVNEGDLAHEIFIVASGAFEVVKREENTGAVHRIATIERGMSIGEVSLLDAGPRSATVRALETSSVLVIPIEDISRLSSREQSFDVQMKINLAYEMSRRLRTTNETTVRTLREKLEEAEIRAEMGRFMSRVLIGTCLYMFALGALKALAGRLSDDSFVTILILFAFAGALYVNIKTSRFPPSAYGFTTRNWKPAVREAILFSIPVLTIMVITKWILIGMHPDFAQRPMFEFYRFHSNSWLETAMLVVLYAAFVPIQEMIARSGMQSSFMMFLEMKHKAPIAIFLSTLLFSSTHLHLSLSFALLVFPVGLFWGWLYYRHPTLIGVSVSHILIGIFAVFVVGFRV